MNRLGGVKAAGPTAWQPRSKPIWFTELGCPAVNKGTNQPNVFYDPKSSESFFPYHSNGCRDDFIQHRYLQAMFAHWNDPANNPYSPVYGGRMVDMARAHVWAWDARPWPDFPSRIETWIDGGNYETGHWLNGRASIASLAEVVAEICGRSGLDEIELARLYGGVTGYMIDAVEIGAAEPAAADAGLCLRQLRGGRRADLRQPRRSGGDRGRRGRPGRRRPRAGGRADPLPCRRDGGAGDGRLRPRGAGLPAGRRRGAGAGRGGAAQRADLRADRALRGRGEGDRRTGAERGTHCA